jgi:hypothetical protein
LPSPDQITSFWSGLWNQNRECQTESSWLREEEEECRNTPQIEEPTITEAIVSEDTHSWKSPGSDRIYNYWYKKLTCTHKKLAVAELINDFIKNPEKMPLFLTKEALPT